MFPIRLVLFAVMVFTHLDTGYGSMVGLEVLDEPIRVCEPTAIFVNLSGLNPWEGLSERERLDGANLTFSTVTVPINSPAELYPFEYLINVTMSSPVQAIFELQFDHVNLTRDRATVVFGCSAAFCNSVGWPSEYCNIDLSENMTRSSCFPLLQASREGSFRYNFSVAPFTLTIQVPQYAESRHRLVDTWVLSCFNSSNVTVASPNSNCTVSSDLLAFLNGNNLLIFRSGWRIRTQHRSFISGNSTNLFLTPRDCTHCEHWWTTGYSQDLCVARLCNMTLVRTSDPSLLGECANSVPHLRTTRSTGVEQTESTTTSATSESTTSTLDHITPTEVLLATTTLQTSSSTSTTSGTSIATTVTAENQETPPATTSSESTSSTAGTTSSTTTSSTTSTSTVTTTEEVPSTSSSTTTSSTTITSTSSTSTTTTTTSTSTPAATSTTSSAGTTSTSFYPAQNCYSLSKYGPYGGMVGQNFGAFSVTPVVNGIAVNGASVSTDGTNSCPGKIRSMSFWTNGAVNWGIAYGVNWNAAYFANWPRNCCNGCSCNTGAGGILSFAGTTCAKPADGLHHFVITTDPNTPRIYLDGVECATTPADACATGVQNSTFARISPIIMEGSMNYSMFTAYDYVMNSSTVLQLYADQHGEITGSCTSRRRSTEEFEYAWSSREHLYHDTSRDEHRFSSLEREYDATICGRSIEIKSGGVWSHVDGCRSGRMEAVRQRRSFYEGMMSAENFDLCPDCQILSEWTSASSPHDQCKNTGPRSSDEIKVSSTSVTMYWGSDVQTLGQSIMNAAVYSQPNSYPRTVSWNNYTLVVPLTNPLQDIFEDIGAFAAGIFGLATESDIEDAVNAARESLKIAQDAMKLVEDLAVVAKRMNEVILAVKNEFYNFAIAMEYDVLETRTNLENLKVTTYYNDVSLSSMIRTTLSYLNLQTQAIWSTFLQNQIEYLVASTSVKYTDPFLPAIFAALTSLSVTDSWPVNKTVGVGTGGILSLAPLMAKRTVGKTLVYEVPLCDTEKSFGGFRIRMSSPPFLSSQQGYFNSNEESDYKTSKGVCMQVSGTPNSYSGVYMQVLSGRYVDGYGSMIHPGEFFTGLSGAGNLMDLEQCIESLTNSKITKKVGDVHGDDDTLRLRVLTVTPNDMHGWVPTEGAFSLQPTGPCEYYCAYDTGRVNVTYRRPGAVDVQGSGSEFIAIAPGSRISLSVTNQLEGSGVPVTLNCYYGAEATSVFLNMPMAYLAGSVERLSEKAVNVNPEILYPELNYRNRTSDKIGRQDEDISQINRDLDEIAERARTGQENAQRALNEISSGKGCNLFHVEGCSGLVAFGYVILWILISICSIYALMMIVGEFRSGRNTKMISLVALLLCNPCFAQTLSGEPTNSTTISPNVTTTPLPMTTGTPSVVTVTNHGSCSIDEHADSHTLTVRDGHCCWIPNNPCDLVEWGGCSNSEKFYNMMVYFVLGMSTIYLLKMFHTMLKMQWSWVTEVAKRSIVLGLQKEYTIKPSKDYTLYCTSQKCKGKRRLASCKLDKLISPQDCELIGVIPYMKTSSDMCCPQCGTQCSIPVQVHDSESLLPILNGSVGISMDGETVLLSSVLEKIEFRTAQIRHEDATAFGLNEPGVTKQLRKFRMTEAVALASLVAASSLPYGNAQVWREGCEMINFSGACCTSSETKSFMMYWIIWGILSLVALSLLVTSWAAIKKYSRKASMALVKKMLNNKVSAIGLGFIAMADGSNAQAFIEIKRLDNVDCSWANLDECSTGHRVVYVVISILFFALLIGTMMIIYRILKCLNYCGNFFKRRKDKEVKNDELASALTKLLKMATEGK